MDVHDLPKVNASLNALSAVLLIAGLICIKKKNATWHKRCMLGALTSSAVFLACYLSYHYLACSTSFSGQGWSRILYFSILIPHTILATGILPFILIAVFHALRSNFEKHRKFARWVWPIWMYVSVTGVLIYFMLYHWFKAPVS